MSTLDKLTEHINRLYPLRDTIHGTRYRVVDQLAGTTELEAINGQSRYIPTRALQDQKLWSFQA